MAKFRAKGHRKGLVLSYDKWRRGEDVMGGVETMSAIKGRYIRPRSEQAVALMDPKRPR